MKNYTYEFYRFTDIYHSAVGYYPFYLNTFYKAQSPIPFCLMNPEIGICNFSAPLIIFPSSFTLLKYSYWCNRYLY